MNPIATALTTLIYLLIAVIIIFLVIKVAKAFKRKPSNHLPLRRRNRNSSIMPGEYIELLGNAFIRNPFGDKVLSKDGSTMKISKGIYRISHVVYTLIESKPVTMLGFTRNGYLSYIIYNSDRMNIVPAAQKEINLDEDDDDDN